MIQLESEDYRLCLPKDVTSDTAPKEKADALISTQQVSVMIDSLIQCIDLITDCLDEFCLNFHDIFECWWGDHIHYFSFQYRLANIIH